MKLNIDCVRDTLLAIEESMVSNDERYVDSIMYSQLANHKLIKKYKKEEVVYTCIKMNEAGFIQLDYQFSNGMNKYLQWLEIRSITFQGHEFLNSVRNDSVWDTVKEHVHKIKITSVSAVGSLAMEVAKTIVADPNTLNSISEKLIHLLGQ